MQELPKIGLGTYRTDPNQTEVVYAALDIGFQLIDTAPNYNSGKSQISIGNALEQYAGKDIVISTKVGFLPKSALPSQNDLWSNDLIENHCISPAYIEYQVSINLKQLGKDAVDILFIHNPDFQLRAKSKARLYEDLRLAFETLEKMCDSKMIGAYGISTWDGFGLNGKEGILEIEELVNLAYSVTSDNHFQYIQLPNNLVYHDELKRSFYQKNGLLVKSKALGLHNFSSSPLLHGELTRLIENEFVSEFGEGLTAAQACLLFLKFFKELDTILVGASSLKQLQENLAILKMTDLTEDQINRIFELLNV